MTLNVTKCQPLLDTHVCTLQLLATVFHSVAMALSGKGDQIN